MFHDRLVTSNSADFNVLVSDFYNGDYYWPASKIDEDLYVMHCDVDMLVDRQLNGTIDDEGNHLDFLTIGPANPAGEMDLMKFDWPINYDVDNQLIYFNQKALNLLMSSPIHPDQPALYMYYCQKQTQTYQFPILISIKWNLEDVTPIDGSDMFYNINNYTVESVWQNIIYEQDDIGYYDAETEKYVGYNLVDGGLWFSIAYGAGYIKDFSQNGIDGFSGLNVIKQNKLSQPLIDKLFIKRNHQQTIEYSQLSEAVKLPDRYIGAWGEILCRAKDASNNIVDTWLEQDMSMYMGSGDLESVTLILTKLCQLRLLDYTSYHDENEENWYEWYLSVADLENTNTTYRLPFSPSTILTSDFKEGVIPHQLIINITNGSTGWLKDLYNIRNQVIDQFKIF